MTPDRLTELIVKGDRAKLCTDLAPLDEKQRAALAETAQALYRRVDEIWGKLTFGEIKLKDIRDAESAQLIKMMSGQKYQDWRVPRWTAGLAVLGVCDKKALKSSRQTSWFASDILAMPQRVLQILDARRPSWLPDWIADCTRDGDRGNSIWPVEHGLIASGALPANTSDEYLQRMVHGLYNRFGADDEVKTDNLKGLPKTLKDALLADPALLEHEVWRLFEVETAAFEHNWSEWRPTLIELCKAGKLDRERLLKSSVHGMALPLRQGVLAGFGKFHADLKPTLSEREALSAEYLALLVAQTPIVVGHALDSLEDLIKAKRLQASAFLDACPPLFHLAKKGAPVRAIKLIKQLVKDEPSCRQAAARAVLAALAHESADVQEAAIALLESLRAELPADLHKEIRAKADHVAASLRRRLDAFGQAQEEKPSSKEKQKAINAEGVSAALQARVAKLSAKLRAAAGVDAVLACIAAHGEPTPAPIEPRVVPRRGAAAAVVPLASLDELIEAVTAFVERCEDVMEIERILDGISRFHLDRPADFDKRVAPLKKRIEARSEPYSDTVLDRAADIGVSQVIRHWLAMPAINRVFGEWWHMPGVFFRLRTQHLIWRMDELKQKHNHGDTNERPVPLLALPTQADGWLDPLVLVERLKIQEKANVYIVDSIDLAQAFLRLTPDGRAEALKKLTCKELYDRDVNIVRFVLGEGAKVPVAQGIGGHELTLATIHARSLIDDVASLDLSGIVMPRAELREDGTAHLSGPLCDDLALPGNLLSRAFSWNVAMPGTERPGTTGDGSWGHGARDDSLLVGWQALVWPGNRRPVCLLGGLGCDSSPSFLKCLPDRDMTWHDEAARLAAWALGSDVPQAKGLITDALIEALGERTLDPALMGKHIAAILANLKLNRVAAVFAEVARGSPLHHWGVFRIIDALLANLKQAPADLHHLLSVLLESATLTGLPLSEPACAFLRSIPGASKTTKLAKQLLELGAAPAKMAAVRAAALSACLDRADRWAALGLK